MDYEAAVAEFLVVNGNTFLAPQYAIGSNWSFPDFVAIRPSVKQCFVVEVSAAWNLYSLRKKIENRERQWFEKLIPQMEAVGVSEQSWSYEVLVFIRQERIAWFEKGLSNTKGVYVWPLECTLEPWRWLTEIRQPDFSLRGRREVLSRLP